MTSELRVDALKTTDGTSVVDFDASGNISTTGHISQGKVYFASAAWDGTSTNTTEFSGYEWFTAYETSDHNFSSGQKKIQYNNDYNILNASTGVVTIPADGVWLLTGHYSNTTSTTARRIGELWINNVWWGEWIESYGQYDDVSTTRILKLSKNDTLKFGNNSGLKYPEFGFELARLG